jgi:hypothetical protein
MAPPNGKAKQVLLHTESGRFGSTLTDDEISNAVDVLTAHDGNASAAARSIGMPETSFQRRVKAAAERGLLGTIPVLPGYFIKNTSTQLGPDGELQREWIRQAKEPGETFEMPAGHIIKGISALVGGDGRTMQQWVKTRNDQDNIDWVEVLKNAFAEYKGRAKPIKAPLRADKDFLNLIPCNDWHINMLTWWREVGESWDLKIAERVIGEAIDVVIGRTRPAGTAVVLGGGDLMHNDDNTNRTAKSHNLLDADGRHEKGVEVAQRLMVRTIEAALRHNKKVIVRILKGNHDEYSSVAIAHFLKAWFHNEPRIKVDLDGSLFWWYRFGSVLLGATHGHTVKISQMPGIMATRRAEDWGQTKFRYVHGFHIHHKEKIATEGEGVICETHQAPIPQDGFNFGSGYLAGRSVQTITYHKDIGEHGRTREAIMDASVVGR